MQYKVYVSCIICMNWALSTTVYYIQYVAWMSDLSDLIDILDDDGVLHLTNSTTGVASRAVGIASHVASSRWFPFTGLFVFNSLNSLIFPIFAYTLAPFFGRLLFWDS